MANEADLDFGGLAVGVSGHDPLTEELQAVHLCLERTSDMVVRPLLPECPSEVSRRAQDLVSFQCCGAVFLPGATVPADGYDGISASVDDRTVASCRVVSQAPCRPSPALRGSLVIGQSDAICLPGLDPTRARSAAVIFADVAG